MPDKVDCVLCASTEVQPFFEDKRRGFFRCQDCSLVFADPASRLSAEAEKAVYDLHQNRPDDERYRAFLRRLATPLLERLPEGENSGLDYGSGPGPTLSLMLEEAGQRMAIYDPFYHPDSSNLNRQYDFITCTEAIEHFHTPLKEWRVLLNCLRPGGLLAIMTKLLIEPARFSQWTYKNDPTHVSFFSRETFQFLCIRDGMEHEILGNDIIFIQKKR